MKPISTEFYEKTNELCSNETDTFGLFIAILLPKSFRSTFNNEMKQNSVSSIHRNEIRFDSFEVFA